MEATIKIKMDNAAFTDECNDGEDRDDAGAAGGELALILRDLAKHVEEGCTSRRLMDSNGNHIGHFEITE